MKNIDSEFENWKNLNKSSEKMIIELNARKEKIVQSLTTIELSKLNSKNLLRN